MSQAVPPNATEVLRGLRLVRSDDPAERQQAITILRTLKDDPRVLQVFELLYERDPDPGVRQTAWAALKGSDPSIPAPVVAPPPGPKIAAPPPPPPSLTVKAPPPPPPSLTITAPPPPPANVSAPPAAPPVKAPGNHRAARAPSRSVFLMNPSNGPTVAKEMRRLSRRRHSGRLAFVLVGLCLLVAGVFWGLVLPDWLAWYRLEQDGVTVNGTISALRAIDDEYTVFYRFFPLDRDEFEDPPVSGEQATSESVFAGLTEDDPIKVTYWPDDPDVARLPLDNPADDTRDLQTIIAAGLTGLMIVFLIVGNLQRRGRPRWLGGGRGLVRGEVASCSSYRDDDDDFHVKIRYRFRSPSGRTLTGQTSRLRNDLTPETVPAPGTPVAIFYRHDRSFMLM